MRNEYIDMSEFVRRMNEEIYDVEEFEKAYKWTRENCKEGPDNNPEGFVRTDEQKDEDWKTSVKMTLIARDLMVGNEKLAEKGYEEEAFGRNALIAGFQGQRQWTDHFPNGDFMEAILNTSFDWNGKRAPYLLATENDNLNAVSMLFGYLLTNTAQALSGVAEHGVIHMINSGAATLDGAGEQTSAD